MIVAKLTPYDIDRQQGVLDVHQPTLLKLAHDEKDQEPPFGLCGMQYPAWDSQWYVKDANMIDVFCHLISARLIESLEACSIFMRRFMRTSGGVT